MSSIAALALARGIKANDPVALAQMRLLDEAALRHPAAREFLKLVTQMDDGQRRAMFARLRESGIGHPIGQHDGSGVTTSHNGHRNWPEGLPAEIQLPALSRAAGLASTDHWTLRAEPKEHNDYHGKPERITIQVEPRLPSPDFKQLPPDKYGHPQGFYDSRIATYTPSDEVYGRKVDLNPETELADRPTGQDHPDTLWRGISYGEMQHIRSTGNIQSHGEYNFADQEGQTFFSTGILHAESYANGFAPVQYVPSFDRPSYIIGIKRPAPSQIAPSKETLLSHEVGVVGPVPASSITEVHEARPYFIRPGEQDLRLQWDGSYTDSSASPVRSSVGWRTLNPADLFGHVAQGLVLQAQSARDRYIHWLLSQRDGTHPRPVGSPVSTRTYHDFLQPFTGPHGSLSGSHGAAAEHIRSSAKHASDLIDAHTAWHAPAFQAHLDAHPEHSVQQILEAFHGKVEIKNGKNVRGPSFLAKSRADERKRLAALEKQHGIEPDPLLVIKAKDATTADRYPHQPAGDGMLTVPGSVAMYHPQMQMMMHDQAAFMGLDQGRMEEILAAWMEDALSPWDLPKDLEKEPDPMAHITHNRHWYRNVFDWVSHQSERFGVSHDRILGATARLSPLRKWGSDSNPLRGDLAPDTNRGGLIALARLLQERQDVWITPHEVAEYHVKNAKQIASGDVRHFPPDHITLNEGTPTKVPQNDLSPLELASFTRLAKDEKGHLIPLFKPNGDRATDFYGAPAFTPGLGVVSITGPRMVGAAIAVLRGDKTVDEMVNGPKIRTFNNNIMSPNDPFLAVIDTWQYRALLVPPDPTSQPVQITAQNPLTGALEAHTLPEWEALKRFDERSGKWEKIVTPQGLFQGQPRLAPYADDTGIFPLFADAVRAVATRYNMLPSEVQALTWVAIQRNVGREQGVMRQYYPDAKITENPLDEI